MLFVITFRLLSHSLIMGMTNTGEVVNIAAGAFLYVACNNWLFDYRFSNAMHPYISERYDRSEGVNVLSDCIFCIFYDYCL